ncbi:MAG: DUF423 domain-containing protein [Planctomycetales bacterium]|nr:DUF423 domain-containing protein [Planctomycetales bacterium]
MSGIVWIRLAGLLGALGVIIGAFGAHGFDKLPMVSGLSPTELAKSHDWLETGVQYHMYHALAILGIGVAMMANPEVKLNAAGIAFFVGILIFSGMLYVMAVTHVTKLGAVVPIGGASFIIGWVVLLFTRYRPK